MTVPNGRGYFLVDSELITERMIDIESFVLFFFVAVQMGLIYIGRKRKLDEQIHASQNETNRLLARVLDELKKTA